MSRADRFFSRWHLDMNISIIHCRAEKLAERYHLASLGYGTIIIGSARDYIIPHHLLFARGYLSFVIPT